MTHGSSPCLEIVCGCCWFSPAITLGNQLAILSPVVNPFRLVQELRQCITRQGGTRRGENKLSGPYEDQQTLANLGFL